MPSIINASTSGAGGVITTADASGQLELQTAGVTRQTIDVNGNVGIGVTPAAWNSPIKAVQVNTVTLWSNTSNTNVFSSNVLRGSAYAASYISTGFAGEFGFNLNGVGEWAFSTAPSGSSGAACTLTERMRIDSSGNVLMGATSNIISGLSNKVVISDVGGNTEALGTFRNTTSGIGHIGFFNPNGRVGEIFTNASSTTYSTSSDYRLKENIAPMTGALDTVAQLKPVTYKWKVDGSDGQGFIAHELQAVVPDCVTGEKDAVDEEGNPQYQGIDTSFLVATLTAAIQELKARIEVLEGASA